MTLQTTLTVRLDSDVKAAAKQRADALGLSLSAVISNQLRRFINGAPVVIDDDSLIPSEAVADARRQAMIEYRSGQYTILDSPQAIADYDPTAHG
ncbi:MAG: hypothetical protein LBS56_07000 [Propionibacteriaceae bacterium]|jgi:antitoxin component of RelBE/YafQ-DinJ toxin-antitoxin module|nr:hypothetical protein [Propionibacteriaceae bacterium]